MVGFVLLYFYTLCECERRRRLAHDGLAGLRFDGQSTSASVLRCMGGGAMLR